MLCPPGPGQLDLQLHHLVCVILRAVEQVPPHPYRLESGRLFGHLLCNDPGLALLLLLAGFCCSLSWSLGMVVLRRDQSSARLRQVLGVFNQVLIISQFIGPINCFVRLGLSLFPVLTSTGGSTICTSSWSAGPCSSWPGCCSCSCRCSCCGPGYLATSCASSSSIRPSLSRPGGRAGRLG